MKFLKRKKNFKKYFSLGYCGDTCCFLLNKMGGKEAVILYNCIAGNTRDNSPSKQLANVLLWEGKGKPYKDTNFRK